MPKSPNEKTGDQKQDSPDFTSGRDDNMNSLLNDPPPNNNNGNIEAASGNQAGNNNTAMVAESDEETKKERKDSRVKFPFKVYIDRDICYHFEENNEEVLKEIRESAGVQEISFDNTIVIPENDGRVISIDSDDLERKKLAIEKIAGEILRLSKKSQIIGILVPEALVSFLIGQRGRQIDQLSAKSNTEIVVYHPIRSMKYRVVKIKGRPMSVAKACGLIYSHIEDKTENIEDIERPPKYLDVERAEVTAKLVFPQSILPHLYGKDKSNMNKLVTDYDVEIKFEKNHDLAIISRDEAICYIEGRLSNVQKAIRELIARDSTGPREGNDRIKILIPNNFVNKLIGQKGKMIRDLAAKSGGAQIKIDSDKQLERSTRIHYSLVLLASIAIQDCVVRIAGKVSSRQIAVYTILEHIENFKIGGPVMKNGKHIFSDESRSPSASPTKGGKDTFGSPTRSPAGDMDIEAGPARSKIQNERDRGGNDRDRGDRGERGNDRDRDRDRGHGLDSHSPRQRSFKDEDTSRRPRRGGDDDYFESRGGQRSGYDDKKKMSTMSGGSGGNTRRRSPSIDHRREDSRSPVGQNNRRRVGNDRDRGNDRGDRMNDRNDRNNRGRNERDDRLDRRNDIDDRGSEHRDRDRDRGSDRGSYRDSRGGNDRMTNERDRNNDRNDRANPGGAKDRGDDRRTSNRNYVSRSRSRDRSRSLKKNADRRQNTSGRRGSPEHGRSPSRDRFTEDRQEDRANQKFLSYYDDQRKNYCCKIEVLIPQSLRPIIVGKKGMNIRMLNDKSKSMLTCDKNEGFGLVMNDGFTPACILTINGSPGSNGVALEHVQELIIEYERSHQRKK